MRRANVWSWFTNRPAPSTTPNRSASPSVARPTCAPWRRIACRSGGGVGGGGSGVGGAPGGEGAPDAAAPAPVHKIDDDARPRRSQPLEVDERGDVGQV